MATEAKASVALVFFLGGPGVSYSMTYSMKYSMRYSLKHSGNCGVTTISRGSHWLGFCLKGARGAQLYLLYQSNVAGCWTQIEIRGV